MKSKKTFVMLGVVLIMVFSLTNVSYANLINGDFSSELVGWTTEGIDTNDGNVLVNSNEEVLLEDNPDWYSALYQGVALAPFTYTIEFDFKNVLSTNVPAGGFADTFYASLYFINDMTSFNLENGVYGDDRSLFNMDYIGVFDDEFNPGTTNGTLSSSSKGDDWIHFSYTFQNSFNFVIPVFELEDWNLIPADSCVLLDNVSVAPVPEPATLLLLGSGLAALMGLARKRRKYS